ncbi:MAG: hypothetical protein WBM90_08750, partial [Acidimicrobiia bacterium]
ERARTSRGHGRLLALALALVLVVPVVALATENSVPGDLLYPIKRVVEPVVRVFDSNAPLEHRVREVEVLFDIDAPEELIVRRVDVARDVVTEDHPTLSNRIDRVVKELDRRRGPQPIELETDDPTRTEPPGPADERVSDPDADADPVKKQHNPTTTLIPETTTTPERWDDAGDR